MSGPASSKTRLSLLGRLAQPGPVDQAAWKEFVDIYGTKIYKWCRRWQLQDADAQDVTQQVLLKLSTKLTTFTYDPSRSFRAWLRTLTHHAWQDFLGALRRPGQGTGESSMVEFLSTVEARRDLLQRLDEEFDRERLEEAMARVRARVEPATWEAFQMTEIDGVPAAEAARRLNKKVAAVYVCRGRVQKMLQEEVRQTREAESKA